MPRRIKALEPTDSKDERPFAERYPNLAAQEEWDREEHVKAAVRMGTPESVARRHAAEEAEGHQE